MPIKLPSFRARRDVYPADLWTKCPSCETMLFNKQLDKAHAGLPDLRPPLPAVGRDAARASSSIRAPGPSATPASSRSTPSDSSTRSRTRTGSPRPRRRPGCAMRPCGGRRRWSGRPSRSASWTSGSWAARWAPSSARRSPAPPSTRSRRASPLVIVSASGGARMQEGTLALMQLAKTLAALERLRVGGVPFVSRPVRPDDRRRVRLVRGGRRRQHRRTERAHRVRRLARVGRHDRPGAAGRLPALRVPVRAWLHRPRRRPARAARRADRAAAPAPGPRRGDRRHPGRPRHRDARLPAVLVPVHRWPSGSAIAPTARRHPRRRPTCRPTATRATPSGRASSSRATSPGRGRSNSSRR